MEVNKNNSRPWKLHGTYDTYEEASLVKTGLLEKDKIPKNVNRKLYKLNICDNRIRALKKGEEINVDTGDVSLQPKICDFNLDKQTKQTKQNNQTNKQKQVNKQ